MSEEIDEKKVPISTVRFGIGKEMQLYLDELVVTVGKRGGKREFHWKLSKGSP